MDSVPHLAPLGLDLARFTYATRPHGWTFRRCGHRVVIDRVDQLHGAVEAAADRHHRPGQHTDPRFPGCMHEPPSGRKILVCTPGHPEITRA